MKIRSVERIIIPPDPHMVGDGFRVHNFIPAAIQSGMARMDPFVMLDYGSKYYFPPSEVQRGVGVHPHRGFETVTIAYHGRVAHHDSAGNSGVIGEGEVQWMTAASGVLHKEYHEKEFSRKGGEFQMVQLWVNLPAREKMSPPRYQAITREMINRVELPGNGGQVEVIAGRYSDAVGPASTFTPVSLMNAILKQGHHAVFTFPAEYNTAVLVIEGTIRINGSNVAPADHLILLGNDGESFDIEAREDSIVLVMSGEPIREPIVPYGPFVMNTRQEIVKAFEDLEAGKFGFLED